MKEVKKTSNYALSCIYFIYINFACLFWCLSICLHPINVKRDEPITSHDPREGLRIVKDEKCRNFF